MQLFILYDFSFSHENRNEYPHKPYATGNQESPAKTFVADRVAVSSFVLHSCLQKRGRKI